MIEPSGTLMHLAAEFAGSQTLQLLQRGNLKIRDIKIKNKNGLTPVEVGLQRQDPDPKWMKAFFNFLKSIDENCQSGASPIEEQIGCGDDGAALGEYEDGSDGEFEDAAEFQVEHN